MNRFFKSPGSKENPPRMIVEKDGMWYMTSRPYGWELRRGPHGYVAGDSCSMTAKAAYTYPKDKKFMDALLSLTPIGDGKWRRHPFNKLTGCADPIKDMTRDQYIRAISTLALQNYPKAVEAINATRKFRLSKYNWYSIILPNLFFWKEAIKHKDDIWGKVFAKLYTTTVCLKTPFNIFWGEMTRNMLGRKAQQVHPNDKPEFETMPTTKVARFVEKNLRPKVYPLDLTAWKLYTLRKLNLTRAPLASLLTRVAAGKFNYMIALLTGKKINKSLIKDYKPRLGWIWQGHIDSIRGQDKFCTSEEAKYNAMDKDLLWVLWDKLD